jgi:hypothetical protein
MVSLLGATLPLSPLSMRVRPMSLRRGVLRVSPYHLLARPAVEEAEAPLQFPSLSPLRPSLEVSGSWLFLEVHSANMFYRKHLHRW